MKIRNGFVSNSSSSSFVLNVGVPFTSPIEIAYHMLMERDWPDDNEMLQKLVEMVRNKQITEKDNLSFSSTNYDTYIYFINEDSEDSRIGIYTCNNTDWKFPSGVIADNEDFGYSNIQGKDFVFIESGITANKLTDDLSVEISKDINIIGGAFDLYCTSCYKEMCLAKTKNKNFILCPKCQTKLYFKDLINPESKWKKI